MYRKALFAAAAVVHAATAARAHVVVDAPSARAGAYHVLFFRVGHGCDGSPTTALRIEIPESIQAAKPQPKPGWALTIERTPLAAPRVDHGKALTDRVAAITWSGRLEDAQWDQFGLQLKLPDAAGPIAFPVVQTCDSVAVRWDGATPSRPAPVLDVEPVDVEPHHH